MGGILPADQPRELIAKASSTTNPEYGFSSLDNLPIEYLLENGVIALDKPAGPTRPWSHWSPPYWSRKCNKSNASSPSCW